jgi:glc operon protein GlcG
VTMRRTALATLFALFALVAAPAGAQVSRVSVINAEGARAAIAAATEEARRNNWTVSIAVVDISGTLVAFHRLDSAPPASVDLSIGKARTAARFKTTSKDMEDLATRRSGFLGVEGLTAVEGGVPITVDGAVVGAVGVSGETSQQDAQIASAGAAAAISGSRRSP